MESEGLVENEVMEGANSNARLELREEAFFDTGGVPNRQGT